MNYVEKLRQAIMTELPTLPAELADVYVLQALNFGQHVTNEHVHDAWSVWKNVVVSEHKSLIPFDELPTEIQELDSKYRDGIIRAVKKVKSTSGS